MSSFHQYQNQERAGEACPMWNLLTFDPDDTNPGEAAINEPIVFYVMVVTSN